MVEVQIRGILPANSGCALFVGNDKKVFVINVEPNMGAVIGMFLRATPKERPLTHDLFKTVLDDLSVKVDRVVITQLQEGTFYAEVDLVREGGALRISSRPSDAIALAVRYEEPVPIFVEEAVLDEAGVLFEAEEDEEQIEQFREFLEQVSPEDFA